MEDKEVDDLAIEREKTRYEKAVRMLKFGYFIERLANRRKESEIRRIQKRRKILEGRQKAKKEKKRIADLAIKKASKSN